MNNNIKLIFEHNIFLLGIIDKTIFYFRIQNYDAALRNTTMMIDYINVMLQYVSVEKDYFNKEYDLVDMSIVSAMLGDLMKAQENKDFVLLADLYEIQIMPLLYKLQEHIIANEVDKVDMEQYTINLSAIAESNKEIYKTLELQEKLGDKVSNEYQIEFTSCGLKTLAIDRNHNLFYLHSNRNVISEAFALANAWYQEDKSEYIIYGLGLGYHVDELANLDNGIIIDVYESDINIIQMACRYFNIHKILENPNVHIYYDPDFVKLAKRLNEVKEETEFVIHYPSLRTVKDLSQQDKLETYFIQYSSIKNQSRYMNGNFRENIKNFDDIVDSQKDKFEGKDLYIIAAGPSLDKNFMQLKKIGKDSIILATGTVLKKLLNAGIKPDYFIVSDAYSRTYSQIVGLEQENIPMLYLSTAFKSFAKNYKGRKYIIFQRDFSKAEVFTKRHGFNLYNTGGSVSTTALDIGIQLKCKKIIFLGLDLGYPDNLVHASDTSLRKLSSKENLKQVSDIHGNQIYTTKILNIYRNWIEDRIKEVSGIEFIDATEGGACIKGMKIENLSDVIGVH